MPKKRRVIASEGSTKLLSTTAGTEKQKSNTRMATTIRSVSATSLAFLFLNGQLGASDANLPAPLTVQSSVRLFNGATALGSGFSEPGSITIDSGHRGVTAPVALTALQGYTAVCCAHADAGTGKKVPLTIYSRDVWGFAKGDVVAPSLDGTLPNSVEGWPSSSRAYFPTALTGITATKAVGFLGHSLVEGNGTLSFRGFAQEFGDAANVAAFQMGIGSSGIGSYSVNDRATLDLVDVVVILWSINDINSAVGAGTATATFVTDQSNAHIPVVKDLHTMGKKVYICTEGPCGPVGDLVSDHYVKLAAWNAHVRSSAVSVMGADGYLDVASVLFPTTDSGVLKSIYTADAGDVIHWGPTAHNDVGQYIATQLASLGVLGEDSTTFTEALRVEFDGAITTVPGSGASTAINGLTPVEKYQDRWMFRRSGTGTLGVVSPPYDAFVHYLVPMADAGHSAGRVEMMGTYRGLPWTSVGYGVGWTEKAFVGGKVFLRGYCAHLRKTRLVIFRHSDADGDGNVTEVGAVNLDAELSVGQKFRIVFDWIPGTGANCDLTATLYSESLSVLKSVSVTGDSTAGIYNGSLSPVFVYMAAASGGLEPYTQADVCERFIAYDYSATAPDSVTVASTLQVERGGRRPISVLVKDATGAIMAGVVVTASSSASGVCAIGGPVVTDGSGIALFDDADAPTVPGSATVGATATLTFTAGPVSAATIVAAVNALSGGGSGGGSGENNMTVDSIADYSELTSSWTEVVEVAEGDVVRLTPAGAASPQYYLSASAPSVTRGVLVPANGLMLTIPTGKSLYLKGAGPAGALVEIGS